MLITSCCLFLQYSFFYSFRAIINILDEKSVFWIVLAGQEWEDWKDEPYVQQRFFFPTMTKPLRSTKSIIQFVQKEEPSPDEKVWTCYPCVMPTALDYSDMPDNLLEGAGTDVFKVRTQLTIPETIASAFNSFPEDERILLISDRRTYQVVSVIEKLALEIAKIRNGLKPLIYGFGQRSIAQSSSREVYNWMGDADDLRDIFATQEICRGYQFPYVIHLANKDVSSGWRCNIWTRCTSKLVIIDVGEVKDVFS